MITDEMVEKAARAISGLSGAGWLRCDEYDKRVCRKDARAALASVLPLIVEEAAKVIEANEEAVEIGPGKNRRILQPRTAGNLSGLAFAAGIRSLSTPITSQSNQNTEGK